MTLQEVAMEQTLDCFTLAGLDTAARTLGFGVDNVLGVEYDEEFPDDVVENAWRDSVKRSWRDPEHGSEMQRLSNEAFRILAETRGSIRLRKIWEDDGKNPDRAYSALEIQKDVDEYTLITAYNMRVREFILSEVADANYKLKLEETPLRIEKLREAMTAIAEVRDSERLRQFLSTGRDRK